MIGLVRHIKITFLVHIIHHIFDVILHIGSELMHAIQKPHERLAKVLSHHGSPENPGKEVPRGDMVDKSLVLVRRRGRGDIHFDYSFRIGAPFLKLSRSSGARAFSDEEALNQGKAFVGEELLERYFERWSSLRLPLAVEIYMTVPVAEPQLLVLRGVRLAIPNPKAKLTIPSPSQFLDVRAAPSHLLTGPDLGQTASTNVLKFREPEPGHELVIFSGARSDDVPPCK